MPKFDVYCLHHQTVPTDKIVRLQIPPDGQSSDRFKLLGQFDAAHPLTCDGLSVRCRPEVGMLSVVLVSGSRKLSELVPFGNTGTVVADLLQIDTATMHPGQRVIVVRRA